MPTLVPTIGGVNSNSYETHAEANTYFDERMPLDPPWVASGQEVFLIMATRTLDALAQPFKTFFSGDVPYYRIRRRWTGSPATATQRLAWPRVGMFDHNGNALDFTISSATVASPTVITTNVAHRLSTGAKVLIDGSNTTPLIDGEQTVTVISTTTFSIPVAVTTAGTTGRVLITPQPLKDAESELAGQLKKGDRTLDNDVIIQGITDVKAGSVGVSFKDTIIPQVIPDAVYNIMPQSWLTDELYEPAQQALFDVVSD